MPSFPSLQGFELNTPVFSGFGLRKAFGIANSFYLLSKGLMGHSSKPILNKRIVKQKEILKKDTDVFFNLEKFVLEKNALD